MLKFEPAVFAVGREYHIMAMVEKPSLMWVEVGGRRYYDETNGILRSIKNVHRMIVPAEELNAARGYTVCEKEIIERRAYFTETEPLKQYKFDFTPVKSGGARAFHIADTHSLRDEPVAAAKAFGKIDFLILNGDILDCCERAEDFGIVYDIAAAVTHGEIPIIFSRGNHDMRGANTEIFSDYTPNCGGKTYFTFRLGDIWGMVLDCGEDKVDSDGEYGGTVCCRQFRQRQTEFIKGVIENAQNEYLPQGVKHRLVISHIPFTYNCGGKFEIETGLYAQWAALLEEYVKPQLMVYAHLHTIDYGEKGGVLDSYGIQPCPAVTASYLDDGAFAGVGLTFTDSGISLVTVADSGELTELN